MISAGGTIRGAIAYSLVLSLDDKKNDVFIIFKNIRLIKNTVLFVVLFTTIFVGGSVGKFIDLLF